nr:hypothetical protein [candidate division Zixibacteria bacterium]
MICDFCGEKFSGRAVKQAGQTFCSIECADMAAEVEIDDLDEEDDNNDDAGLDETDFYEEDDLDLNSIDEEELY